MTFRRAAAATGVLALMASSAWPATHPSDAVAAPRPAEDTWSLTDVLRTDDGLVVTGTIGHHGQHPARIELSAGGSAVPQGWCSAVQVVNEEDLRVGLAQADGDECALELGRATLQVGEQTTFSVPVADPGGRSVDVVLAGRLTATGVPLDGRGPSSPDPGVLTPAPRVTAVVGRSELMTTRFTRAGAAVTGQSVDLSTDVLFAFDSDVLGPDAGAAIAVASQQLQAQPSRTLSITGHTDSRGDTAYNLGLSQRRAEAVRAALAAQLGAGWTLNASGVGESDPVADESRPSGHSGAEADAAVAEAQRVDRRVAVVPG